ncbi:hypothetical protein L1049_010147 [Liquidambar formosana]|uniref:Uncharacterized protein n=1 Tax=Liquidambar formosana TaxID=63359 RepID=A0AAP0NAJ5_LIQFO
MARVGGWRERLSVLTVSVGGLERDLVKLVLKFFKTMMLMTVPAKYRPREGHEIGHILDLIRSCLLPSSSDIEPQRSSMVKLRPMTDLLVNGINFKSGNPDDILNIKLNKGVVEIPPIKIQRNSESLLRNLIAYEQCDGHCTHQLTSYAVFLDCLINTKTDAAVIIGEGIVVPELRTDDMYLLFNRLYNDTIPNNFQYSYSEVTDRINKYCNPWKRYLNVLSRDYFGNPWAVIAFVNGIVTLLLAMLQLYFGLSPPVRK